MPQGIYLPEGFRLDTMQNRRYTADRSGMARAMADGAILEGIAVACSAEGDLTVHMGQLRGVIPQSEAILDGGKPVAVLSRVGRPVCFTVTGRQGDRYLLSRRAAQQAARSWFAEHLQPGEIVRVRVTRLESFGAFVDLGCGLPALIGIENISVSRIGHPRERLEPGQSIPAVVLSVDRTRGRVVLTHRELLGTWEENLGGIEVGETRLGIVRGIPDYGVFVELTPNLSGLAEPYVGTLEKGDGVSVFVKSILPDRMKIKLQIIDRLAPRRRPICEDDYFIRSGKLDYWQYSPENCRSRVIATCF